MKEPEKCPRCGERLYEISERNIVNRFIWEGDGYVHLETLLDGATYHCGNCGLRLKGNLAQKVVEQLK